MLQTLALAVNTSGLSAAPELSSTHQYSGGGVTANQNRLWSVKSWLFRGRMWALSPKRKLLWLSPRRCYYNKEKQFKKNSCPFFIISSRSGSNSHHQQIKKRLLLELKTLEILTFGVFVSTHKSSYKLLFYVSAVLSFAVDLYLSSSGGSRQKTGRPQFCFHFKFRIYRQL